ncbi:MAG: hypothetical protein KF799_04195 [Bdellovibrionales bacterium]|nr:hypothetical protein [Bdellovibrionales bacterium]
MRVRLSIFTVVTAVSVVACGIKPNTKARERGGLSETDYQAIKGLNAMLMDNEDAISLVFHPKSMVSGKATEMSKAIAAGDCVATRNESPEDGFDKGKAVQEFQGSDKCPIYSKREWEYRAANREFLMRHFYYVKPEHKAFYNASGVRSLSSGNGRLWVTRLNDGTQRILGRKNYELFQLADGQKLRVEIVTNQTYRGNAGGGAVTIAIAGSGWSRSGSVTWKASDFSDRTYMAESGQIERENFLELFSFFRLDEIVDNSERMR